MMVSDGLAEICVVNRWVLRVGPPRAGLDGFVGGSPSPTTHIKVL